MSLGLAALLMGAAASPVAVSASLEIAQPVSVTVFSDREMHKHNRLTRREWAAKCRKAWAKRNDLDSLFRDPALVGDLSRLADRFSYGDDGCRKAPAFAAILIERIAGIDPLSALREDVTRLIKLHSQTNTPESLRRVTELKRFLWVRGLLYASDTELGWTEAEKLAFIARDDIWNSLLAQDHPTDWPNVRIATGLLSPASPRYDPAQGVRYVTGWSKGDPDNLFVLKVARMLIDGQSVAKDLPSAEALLWKIAPSSEEARTLILPLVAPRLESKEVGVRDESVLALLKLVTNAYGGYHHEPGAQAVYSRLVPYFASRLKSRDGAAVEDAATKLIGFIEVGNETAATPLLAWLDKQLRSPILETQLPAWKSLTRLVRAGSPAARASMDVDIARTGGVVELGVLDEATNNFKREFITTDDYPPSAIRNAEEGVVSISLLVSPSGRALEATVTKSAIPSLDGMLAKLAARRIAGLKFPDHPGRYVRVTIPDVQFRLGKSCTADGAPTPAVPGAIVVDAECRQPVIQIVPVSISRAF
jgi:hypothetical protein